MPNLLGTKEQIPRQIWGEKWCIIEVICLYNYWASVFTKWNQKEYLRRFFSALAMTTPASRTMQARAAFILTTVSRHRLGSQTPTMFCHLLSMRCPDRKWWFVNRTSADNNSSWEDRSTGLFCLRSWHARGVLEVVSIDISKICSQYKNLLKHDFSMTLNKDPDLLIYFLNISIHFI